MTCLSILESKVTRMKKQTGGSAKKFAALCLLFFCSVVIPPEPIQAQTGTSSAAILVEIRYKPGTSEQWRDAFVKEILPSIREAIPAAGNLCVSC